MVIEVLNINKKLIEKLTWIGVVDPHWLRDIVMCEQFKALETNCVMCKYTIIASRFKLSEDHVRKIIKELLG